MYPTYFLVGDPESAAAAAFILAHIGRMHCCCLLISWKQLCAIREARNRKRTTPPPQDLTAKGSCVKSPYTIPFIHAHTRLRNSHIFYRNKNTYLQ